MGGHLYQQALNDINKAIELAPTEPIYQAEKASLQVRVGMHKEAMETAQQAHTDVTRLFRRLSLPGSGTMPYQPEG